MCLCCRYTAAGAQQVIGGLLPAILQEPNFGIQLSMLGAVAECVREAGTAMKVTALRELVESVAPTLLEEIDDRADELLKAIEDEEADEEERYELQKEAEQDVEMAELVVRCIEACFGKPAEPLY